MAAYAEPSDLVNRLELPTIQRLISDDGQDVPAEDLATDDKLLAALEDASGDVEAAMLVGKRYSVEDLEGLTGNSLATLKRITCTIALAYLLERRPTVHLEQAPLPGASPAVPGATPGRGQDFQRGRQHGETGPNHRRPQQRRLPADERAGGPDVEPVFPQPDLPAPHHPRIASDRRRR